jgi:hypothetical protein
MFLIMPFAALNSHPTLKVQAKNIIFAHPYGENRDDYIVLDNLGQSVESDQEKSDCLNFLLSSHAVSVPQRHLPIMISYS